MCNCQQNSTLCGCSKPRCHSVNCACDVYLSSDCINKVTANFSCSEIETGLTLTETLEGLDQFICDKFNTITNYFTLVNIEGGAEIYRGVNNLGQKELRTITTASSIISITQLVDYVQFGIDDRELSSFVQENQIFEEAENVGTGAGVFKDEVSNTFRFKTLKSSDNSVTIVEGANEIDFSVDITAPQTVIEAGDNITITGAGTTPDPYIISTPDVVIPSVNMSDGITTTVTGNGESLTPFIVEVKNLQKEITGDYELGLEDNFYTIFINNDTTPITISVPDGLPDSFTVGFVQEGVADVTFVTTGTDTLNTAVGYKIKGQFYTVLLEKKLSSTSLFLDGDTKL